MQQCNCTDVIQSYKYEEYSYICRMTCLWCVRACPCACLIRSTHKKPAQVDSSKALRQLGVDSFIPWEDTVQVTVDGLMALGLVEGHKPQQQGQQDQEQAGESGAAVKAAAATNTVAGASSLSGAGVSNAPARISTPAGAQAADAAGPKAQGTAQQ